MASKVREAEKTANKKPPTFLTSKKVANNGFYITYEDQIISEAYIALTGTAVKTYHACRRQAGDNRAISCMHHTAVKSMGYTEDQWNSTLAPKKGSQAQYFVFPAAQVEQYGLTRQQVSRALHELIEAGFIRIFCDNSPHHKAIIYQFVSWWKYPKEEWQPKWKEEIERWKFYNERRSRKK